MLSRRAQSAAAHDATLDAALTVLLIAFAKRLGRDGYLVLDEVIVEKAYAKRLPWATYSYSFAKKRKVWGFQIVVLVWCSCDGRWRLPVGCRLWRLKRWSPGLFRS